MSSKLRNIGGAKGDKFFRYKMPDLQSKVEKPGTNGQQTVILNIAEIAKALHCDPEYPTRFMGAELGAQATFQDTSDRTCCIIKGIFPPADLNKQLNKFIDQFILCPKCRLPETKIHIKSKKVCVTCASCGYDDALNTGHKLEKFILNNNKSKNKSKKKKKDKSGKDKDDSDEKEAPQEDLGPAALARKQVDFSQASTRVKQEITVDTSEEAQKLRMQELLETDEESKASRKLKNVGKVDFSKPEEVLRAFIAETKRDVVEVVSEIQRLKLSHELSVQEQWRVTLEGILDIGEPKKLNKQIKSNAHLFKALAKTKPERLLLITSTMRFLQGEHLQRLPLLLKAFLDLDVLDEDSITSWWDSPPEADSSAVGVPVAKQAREVSEVFVKWLKEDSGDESGSDSD